GILDAAVVAEEPESRGTQLIAFVVAGAEVDTGTLRSQLAQRVPDYLIPAQFCGVEAIPVTSSGKADRTALLAAARRQTSAEYTEPRTDIEATLAVIWQQVLDIRAVSVHDNFFDLGGHSLLAAALAGRIRDGLGVELGVGLLFESPTPGTLAARLGSGDGGG
nr:phosphopantetheine-binding protein [Streptomyces sp. DSM 41633]